ncbi:MAG TPA: methyltransferase domain-containing protein [Casimicrobiaceae bacterium]|nr:methyltransferase domain-containing protein [Casimicrobiaceae bacterium]
MNPIEDFRKFYAHFIVKSSGSSDERLIAAFSAVPREKYLGPGPWQVFVGAGYLPTISSDPRLLYQDILVGLASNRGINNGQPSLHARCLAACAPRSGETVIHIGAGTGYYTAVLAELIGNEGKVLALEIEPDLAARARDNLAHLPNVAVSAASAEEVSLPACDLIYVNAGATHPLPSWLDALKIGGRLIFPLTPNEGFGCMLLVTRTNESAYGASVVTRAAFIPCVGARDDAMSKTLATALERQSLKAVRSLRRNDVPDETAWCAGSGWWLSTVDAAG